MSQNNLRCNLGPTQKQRQPQDNLLDFLEPLTGAKCHPFDSPLHFFLGICLLKQNPTTFLPSITIQQVIEPKFKPSLESATFRKGNSGERDHCVPILPILEDRNMGQKWDGPINQEDEEASWLLLNPVKYVSSSSNYNYRTNKNNGFLFKDEVDEYLNLSEYNSSYAEYDGPSEGDNIVPFQYGESKEASLKHNHQQHIFTLGSDYQTPKAVKGYSRSLCPNLGLDYEPPNTTNSYALPLRHNVCVSSTDVGIVPEIAASDTSTQHSRPPKGPIDRFYGPPIHRPRQLNPIERMARVLRYWEKKKTRNFEKTIRYASRKAYAETRPRIKGRFAKRANVEMEVNQMFSTKIMMDTGYGIVPSFYFPTSIWQ